MSQSGRLIGNEPVPGVGIQTITGNAGGPVPGDGIANITIVGVGDIDVTGNIATNTLTISSSGTASEYVTDDANVATPALGILNILGTATQIQTSSAGNTVTLAFENDVTIPNNLTVANNLEVINDLIVGDNITVSAGDMTVTAGDITVSGSVAADQVVANNGLQVNAGGINSTGQVFFNGAGFANTGVLIRDFIGTVTSSNGANGQVLIGGGLVPAWSSIVAGSGIVITPGVNTLTIAAQNSVAQSFHEDVGIAVPALGVLRIVGSANINTSGAGNTATINLNNDIALNSVIANTLVANTSITSPIANITNNLSVTNTITATTITAAGTVQGSTLHSTEDITAARDIVATRYITGNEVSGITVNAVATLNSLGNLVVSTHNGVLQANAAGLVSATNGNPTGTNGQVLISGPGAPAWGALESADGSVAITYPGNNRINLRAAGAAPDPAYTYAFKAVLLYNSYYRFESNTDIYVGANKTVGIGACFTDLEANHGFNANRPSGALSLGHAPGIPLEFTAQATGLYKFDVSYVITSFVSIQAITYSLLLFNINDDNTKYYTTLNLPGGYRLYPVVEPNNVRLTGSFTTYLVAGDYIKFGFRIIAPVVGGVNPRFDLRSAPGLDPSTLDQSMTYISGYKIA